MKMLLTSLVIMASLAGTALAAPEEATIPALARPVADCSGNGLKAVVARSAGTLWLTVRDHGHVISRKRATCTEETLGGVTTTSYQGGSVFDGGASLRIRTWDARFPQLEGTAHVTVRRGDRTVNETLECIIY